MLPVSCSLIVIIASVLPSLALAEDCSLWFKGVDSATLQRRCTNYFIKWCPAGAPACSKFTQQETQSSGTSSSQTQQSSVRRTSSQTERQHTSVSNTQTDTQQDEDCSHVFTENPDRCNSDLYLRFCPSGARSICNKEPPPPPEDSGSDGSSGSGDSGNSNSEGSTGDESGASSGSGDSGDGSSGNSKDNSGKSKDKSNNGRGNSKDKSNNGRGNSKDKSNNGRGNSKDKSNNGNGNSKDKSKTSKKRRDKSKKSKKSKDKSKGSKDKSNNSKDSSNSKDKSDKSKDKSSSGSGNDGDKDAALRECLEVHNVPPSCSKYATFSNFDLQKMICNDPDCADEAGKLLYCASNGEDNYGCCKKRGVPKECSPFCDGTQEFRVEKEFDSLSGAAKYLPCLKTEHKIVQCHKENHSGDYNSSNRRNYNGKIKDEIKKMIEKYC